MSNIAQDFDIDIDILGVDGVEKWITESFYSSDNGLAPNAFGYSDNIGILTAFEIALPGISYGKRAVFIEAVSNILSRPMKEEQTSPNLVLVCTDLLKSLGLDDDLIGAYENLAARLDEMAKLDDDESIECYQGSLETCYVAACEKVKSIPFNESGFSALEPVINHVWRVPLLDSDKVFKQNLRLLHAQLAQAPLALDAEP